jgi:hypothetical protein
LVIGTRMYDRNEVTGRAVKIPPTNVYHIRPYNQ